MTVENIIEQIKKDSEKEVKQIITNTEKQAKDILIKAKKEANIEAEKIIKQGIKHSENNKKIILAMLIMIKILLLVPDQTHIDFQEKEVTFTIQYTDLRDNIRSILVLTDRTDHVLHDPIRILNDTAFGPDGYNFPGTGTRNDPYLINGYYITDSRTHLIQIENTTKYFKIFNNILNGNESSQYNCISMINVSHVTIEDNIIHDCLNSIYLEKSHKIMITGNPSIDNAIKSLNNGADGFLIKPVKIDELLGAIERHLEKQRKYKRFNEQKVRESLENKARELESILKFHKPL